jgi:hypothetical protein
VKALPGHKLEVDLATETQILFDFSSRLRNIRYGLLKQDEFFNTASTDGFAIVFEKDGEEVRMSASEFMDMVLVDRTSNYLDEGE